MQTDRTIKDSLVAGFRARVPENEIQTECMHQRILKEFFASSSFFVDGIQRSFKWTLCSAQYFVNVVS